MKLRIKALLSLRWNYKRRGVWVWLKGRQVRRCDACGGGGVVKARWARSCRNCMGLGGFHVRGYQRILSEPQRVIDEQTAVAEGVFV